VTVTELVARLPGPILIIGASGFIGANLLRTVLATRADVVGTRLHGGSWRLEGISTENLAYLDLLDPASVQGALDRVQPKVVFHCAAYGSYSFETDVERIHQTNYLALSRLLAELEGRGLHALIHAGTSSEYGTNSAGPSEDAPRRPNSDYAVAKAAAGDLIAYSGMVRGLPACNLRLYSVYGPWEDSSRLIPTLCIAGAEGRLPDFVDPNTSRDFIHVEDAVAAFIAAAARMGPELQGRSFNIATGRRVTIREVADTARTLFGIADPPRFYAMAARRWDLPDWFGNPENAAVALGWRAQVAFADGLADTAAWWRQRLGTHQPEQMSEHSLNRRDKNSISAVIACYQDADAIPVMHRRLVSAFRSIGVDYQIIFVNDCSPDDSAEVIRQLSEIDPHVIGICHSRNFGSQAAFRSGMELVSSEACVLLDGDLQDPPELIPDFVEKWREGHDVVYGRRVRRDMPRRREILYKVFYSLFDRLSDFSIPRNAGDFSLIDRKVIDWLLRCNERDSFLRGLRAYVGFRQTGVDYIRPERMFGTSTNNFRKNIAWAKKAIFSFSTAPLDWLTTLGLGLFVLTLVLMALLAASKLLFPSSAPPGVVTLLLGIMFFGSLNIVGIATIGEYIAKIIVEVKARPPFIRSAIIKGGRVSESQPPRQPLVSEA